MYNRAQDVVRASVRHYAVAVTYLGADERHGDRLRFLLLTRAEELEPKDREVTWTRDSSLSPDVQAVLDGADFLHDCLKKMSKEWDIRPEAFLVRPVALSEANFDPDGEEGFGWIAIYDVEFVYDGGLRVGAA